MPEEKLAYSINNFARLADLSRSLIYREIKDGKLTTIKRRGRVLILADEAKRYLSGPGKEEAQNKVEVSQVAS